MARHIEAYVRPQTAQEIAHTLGQRDPVQGLRLACCIWLTSLRLQNKLAELSPALRQAGIMPVSQLRQAATLGAVTSTQIREQWEKW